MRSILRSTILVAVVAALTVPAFAQDARVAQQVKLRQAAFTVLGAQMSQMGAMAAGRAPYDAKAFRLAAERSEEGRHGCDAHGVVEHARRQAKCGRVEA